MALGARLLQDAWARRGIGSTLLLPLAGIYAILSGVRRRLFALGFRRSARMPVPVIVVGNILVGGTGKTPLVIALIESLRKRGFTPGVVSRGYGGDYARHARLAVVLEDDARRYGDEIVLIARRCQVPAVVGRLRADAARLLLENHPEVDVIVCDDGLQHYGLARDVELVVFDGRGAGNGRLLPAGPLREPLRRVGSASAIVMNGAGRAPPSNTIPAFYFDATAVCAYRLADPLETRQLAQFAGPSVLAAAGIGQPERFFSLLRAAGLAPDTLALPDHFAYATNPFCASHAQFILITEKDAVKCGQLNDPRLWVVPLEVRLGPGLETFVVEKLHACPFYRPAPA